MFLLFTVVLPSSAGVGWSMYNRAGQRVTTLGGASGGDVYGEGGGSR